MYRRDRPVSFHGYVGIGGGPHGMVVVMGIKRCVVFLVCVPTYYHLSVVSTHTFTHESRYTFIRIRVSLYVPFLLASHD